MARADHHIAIRVSDLDRSIRFYCDALDARPLTAPSIRKGPVIDEVFEPGAQARMCFLGLDAGNLELWQFLTPETPIPRADQPRLGQMHFAVTVDAVDDVAERVVAAGGRLRFPVRNLGGSDARMVYCEDPDGNVFELLDTDVHGTIARIVAGTPEARAAGRSVKADVAVVGAGPAGLVCAAILAQAGKRVALVERERTLGGRSRHWRYRGHEIGLGSHLVEDPGDSLTRVCELVGVPVEHSERSDSMPFWDRDRWKPIQEFYGGAAKQGLKRCIEALVETPVRRPRRLGPRLAARVDAAVHERRGRLPGVGGDLDARADHEPLVGALGLARTCSCASCTTSCKRTAGYSFWPMGGWDAAVGGPRRARSARSAARSSSRPPSTRVLVENGAVQGRRARGRASVIEAAERRRQRAGLGACRRSSTTASLPWDLRERITAARARTATAPAGSATGSPRRSP